MSELMKILSADTELSLTGATRVRYELECGCKPSRTLPRRYTDRERSKAIHQQRMKCPKHPWRDLLPSENKS